MARICRGVSVAWGFRFVKWTTLSQSVCGTVTIQFCVGQLSRDMERSSSRTDIRRHSPQSGLPGSQWRDKETVRTPEARSSFLVMPALPSTKPRGRSYCSNSKELPVTVPRWWWIVGCGFLIDLFKGIQKIQIESILQIHLPTVAYVVCVFSIGVKFL